MTTKQISYVLELSRSLNFNRAAENLYISQPALSYQIKALEGEIGFLIFQRDGKSIRLTPAGAHFCKSLEGISLELRRTVEQGQNISSRYRDSLNIYCNNRTCIPGLPGVLRAFASLHPDIFVIPRFYRPDQTGLLEEFIRGGIDIYFEAGDQCDRLPGLKKYPFYQCGYSLICLPEDPLAAKIFITAEDLDGRTLMVGGGSSSSLRALQQEIIARGKISYFNSEDHDTTLTNVAAGRGVCIAPAYLNDGHPDYAWVPFEGGVPIPCNLYIHENDHREMVMDMLDLLLASPREF